MKLKFRADPEDLTIFGIFAVFLLYVVAIGILNLNSFATEGYLHGLNPIPAFTPRFIAATITFYLLALAALFASVGSYFIERDSGFGFTTDKKDKGYSRWAKEREIKEELERVEIQSKTAKAAGVPLILNEKEMWVDNSEYHSLVIGATGSGKTQTVILPLVQSLAKAKESMIITDPKGEIYEKTSNMLRSKGYQILLLNFRDPQNGNAWNPMSLPYKIYKEGNQDKAIELLDDLALNILYDESNKNADPFWEKTSADYFSGVALGLFEDAKEEEININSISLATTVGEEKFGGSTYIKEYFAAKDPASAAAINASSTIMAPNETKGSILSVFKQKVKLFASRENLSEMLSHSDIDLESIGERPTAVFIVIQDEKKTYHSLVTILLKQIYETLISVAQRHGGKLPVRTNFLLDEFANMPPLKDVTTMITAARSRAIRFTMIIQNFAQLDSVYGKDDAETIRGNCGNIIYLITTELKALEEISKMCGEVKSKKDDKTASTPLVTVSDLQRMKQFEVIIMRIRKQPFKTKFTPDYKLKWGPKYKKAVYPSRKKEPVKTFDIKEFVKEQKKKKLLDMMNAASEDAKNDVPLHQEMIERKERTNPMMGNSPFMSSGMSPFGTSPFESNRNMDDDLPRRNMTPSITPVVPETPASKGPIENDFGFDVDELVKKIDAKIAELEKEEKEAAEKEKQTIEKPIIQAEPKQLDIESLNSNDSIISKPSVETLGEVKETRIETPAPQVHSNLVLDEEDDDEFFDDFFDN
ncbi:MAG: DUF87 domain-containing protein [Firmicutes bacterium]|nr:DUF87 domain-containing protein [Bacillota bacterium]